MEAQIITRFLESVGQKADVDLYLKLFRSQKKESFAIIAASKRIVDTALDPFHFDLRILHGLGLVPVVVTGLFEPKDAGSQATRVHEWLREDNVPAQIIDSGPTLAAPVIEVVRELTHMNTLPLLSLEGTRETPLEQRFDKIAQLARALDTRKVIFLSTSAGLEREGTPRISVVNLSVDYDHLLQSPALERRHTSLLRHAKRLLDDMPLRSSVSVVNPLQLLRELFTISGAGTLIRKGSRIETRRSMAGVDRPRLRTLIESAFGRMLNDEAMDRDVERLYLEENYLGVAMLTQSPVGAYLTKFAVDRQAQGEGIGGDVWSMMTRDYPSFFWRARPQNPITPWYTRQADGVVRFPDWHVFWRGLTVEQIEPAIRYALGAQVDFSG